MIFQLAKSETKHRRLLGSTSESGVSLRKIGQRLSLAIGRSRNFVPDFLLQMPLSSFVIAATMFNILYFRASGHSALAQHESRTSNIRSILRLITVVTGALFVISAILNFGYKIPVGFSELSFSFPSTSIGEFEIVIGLILFSAAVFSRLYIYGGGYLLVIVGIASGLSSAQVQGPARTLHELMLPLAIAGIVLLALESRRTYDLRNDRKVSTRDREIAVILQFFVGGLVTLGGAAYAIGGTFPYGTVLGLIHLFVGLAALFAGYAFLKRKIWSQNLLIAINVVTVVYSAFSESAAQLYSLLPPGINDSLIGTIIAIIASSVILYLLSSRKFV